MFSIILAIIKAPEGVVNPQTTMVFSERGGTIGRNTDNFWILDDPERFISSIHAHIIFNDGFFLLKDISTNGTFINGSVEPIGKGNSVALSDGDKFKLGDYEFKASLSSNLGAVRNKIPSSSSSSVDAGPFADLIMNPQQDVDPLTSNQMRSNDAAFLIPTEERSRQSEQLFGHGSQETDPLVLLGKKERGGALDMLYQNHSTSSIYPNRGDALSQSFSLPSAIPEDWDDDLSPEPNIQESPAASHPASNNESTQYILDLELKALALEKENKLLKSQLQKIQKDSHFQDSERKFTLNELALIQSLGLDKNNLSSDKIEDLSRIAGEVIRAAISGMMQVLSSRNSIKNEFRMNVTTIQPFENNPLKFSANIEDAIENMFIKEGNAYKKPVDAIREGFQSITDHQMAVFAGIRAAFNGGIERFSPDILEQNFNKYQQSGLLRIGKKSKNWDFYKAHYSEITNDMDKSFRQLFGDEFVRAYEDQLYKLSLSRKEDTA